MTSVPLSDGRVLHVPSAFILDATSSIEVPAGTDLTACVPLIPRDDLLLFTKRLIDGARKTRRQPRYRHVNRLRLELARHCIDRALNERLAEAPDIKSDTMTDLQIE